MIVKITVKGKDNYDRFTVYSWVLEVKGIIEYETGKFVEVEVIDGDSDEPELYVNDYYVGKGIPGEEGYLIEIIKKALKQLEILREPE